MLLFCRKICFKTPSLCRCLPTMFAMRADHSRLGATDGDERLRHRLGGVLMHTCFCDLLREHDTVAFEVALSSSVALHILPFLCLCAVKPGAFVDRKRVLPREKYYPGSGVADNHPSKIGSERLRLLTVEVRSCFVFLPLQGSWARYK